MGAVISLAEQCFGHVQECFGGGQSHRSRRALVNLQDMGVDMYEPAGVGYLDFQLSLHFRQSKFDVGIHNDATSG